MVDLDSYLRRFRRLMSPPGRPGPIGVPSDRALDITDELAELFTAVDAVDAEAAQIVTDARAQADRRREEARSEAARVRAEAEERAEEDRATAAAERRSRLEVELQDLADAATDEAARTHERAVGRLDDVVAEVVARVLAAAPGDEHREAA